MSRSSLSQGSVTIHAPGKSRGAPTRAKDYNPSTFKPMSGACIGDLDLPRDHRCGMNTGWFIMVRVGGGRHPLACHPNANFKAKILSPPAERGPGISALVLS